MEELLPTRRRKARPERPPDAGTDGATERAIVATILESPSEALARPALRWLVDNSPRSVGDPLCGLALAEVRRIGLEATLPDVIVRLEQAEQIDANGKRFLLTLAGEGLPLALAEIDAQKLVERRRPEQLAQVLRESADQIEHVPTLTKEILAVTRETIDAVAQEGPRRPCHYTARSLAELVRPERDDPNELLRHRFLCRGGALLLAAPTGIGKSTLAVQFALCWALGRETLGIMPARPIRALYVQAENDEGDLAELRDGICTGLEFSDEDRAEAFERVAFATVDDLCGLDFIARAFTPLVEAHRPDIVFVDPLLAFLGADVSKQGLSRLGFATG